jgi:pimeloyl-ACP methyl ester carboxylesterase
MKHAGALFLLLISATARAADVPTGFSADDFAALQRDVKALQTSLKKFATKPDAFADADIFAKGIVWALRYDTKLEPADVALIKKSLARGHQRLAALEADKKSWAAKKGKLARGYVSQVDGSTQPFGLIIPKNYDPAKPIRLDVVLHGSTRPVGMSELRFMSRFEEGDEGGTPPDVDYIELHPLGRVENCYRWAGETDVFEAMDAVRRNYNIDRDRIVLRGMSMGASGTWHLGLKHPDKFVALAPYCGYVDTYNFSKTPKNFVKVENLPPHQEKALHMLDSIDYAANASMVPVVAAMGEKDIFFDAHVLMSKTMEKEGLKLTNLISPGTGHVIDPVTHKEQMRRIAEYAVKGVDRKPRKIRFVTWTLKYNKCHWLQIDGVGEQLKRAEVEASVRDDGSIDIKEPTNVTMLTVWPPVMPKKGAKLRVGGRDVADLVHFARPNRVLSVSVTLEKGKWSITDVLAFSDKRPNLQGPIDDAFTSPFLCVRGTGKPWNPAVQAWSEANLKRFAYEWHRYFRGEMPMKDDKDVTAEDIKDKNLILFGDPGSNALMARALPKLPIHWTTDEIRLGDMRYAAADHAPAFICVNPLHAHKDKYLVINSGHTFHEKELASLNYLLFPRLGDWSILKVGGKVPEKPSDPLEEEVIKAGFFDENWKVK